VDRKTCGKEKHPLNLIFPNRNDISIMTPALVIQDKNEEEDKKEISEYENSLLKEFKIFKFILKEHKNDVRIILKEAKTEEIVIDYWDLDEIEQKRANSIGNIKFIRKMLRKITNITRNDHTNKIVRNHLCCYGFFDDDKEKFKECKKKFP